MISHLELILDAIPGGGCLWVGTAHDSVAWAGRPAVDALDAAAALDDVPAPWSDLAEIITLEEVQAMWSECAL